MSVPQSLPESRPEETKRIARVLRIVQFIGSQPRSWSRARLAREFELSERMIDNDLQLIRHGLRYELSRANSGYYFVDGPPARALHLSLPETLALALAAQLARDTGTVDAAVVAGALAQLEGALPPRIVPYLRRATNDTERAPFGPTHQRDRTLALLQQALVEQRRVAMTYRSASRQGALTDRIVEPYHLLPYDRSWLLVSFDHLRAEVRMFKVDRIQECALVEEHYMIPADFDLEAYLGPTWGVLRGQTGAVEDVTLCFTSQAAAWVRDEHWHASQEAEPQVDGSLLLRFRCTITNEFMRWILSYGPEVHVRQPDRLRAEIVLMAERVICVNEGAREDGTLSTTSIDPPPMEQS